MTYFEDSHTIPDNTAPTSAAAAAFPGGPGIIETAPLRGMIHIFLTQLVAMFSKDRMARGAITRMWQIRRLLCVLYKTEKQNYCLWLTRALRADSAWQAQVREDLGGDAALAKWDKRYAKWQGAAPTCETKAKTNEIPKRKKSRTPRRKPLVTHMDRYGLFRLAAISSVGLASSSLPGPQRPSERRVTVTLAGPKPIAITPDDLRPGTVHAGQALTGRSNSPAPNRSRLTQIWKALQIDHYKWNQHLELVDMAITEPEWRGDLEPP